MNMIILNGPTVSAFIEDEKAFNQCVREHFNNLDINKDGVLSRMELRKAFDCLMPGSKSDDEVGGFYDIIFSKFDADHNGTIDMDEFRSEMKEIMLAVARGIGDSPIQVALQVQNDSLLMRAVEHESTVKND